MLFIVKLGDQNDNYIESVNDLIYSSSNPPTLANIVGAQSLFVNNGTTGWIFNVNAIAQSVNAASAAGTTRILTGLATSSGTEIYCVTEQGKTYPIDSSSTISIRQDIANTGFIYLDLKSSVLSNYINNVFNKWCDIFF
jgi:hypothetical protein